jgi:nitrite reductase (NADH) small subunit
VNMTDWTRLVSVEECPPGRGRYVMIGDLELAVFHLTEPDRFVVSKNSCPHAGGNLAAGMVSSKSVVCPWHLWEFDLDTGACTLSENVHLRRYPCRVIDGYVCADLRSPV